MAERHKQSSESGPIEARAFSRELQSKNSKARVGEERQGQPSNSGHTMARKHQQLTKSERTNKGARA